MINVARHIAVRRTIFTDSLAWNDISRTAPTHSRDQLRSTPVLLLRCRSSVARTVVGESSDTAGKIFPFPPSFVFPPPIDSPISALLFHPLFWFGNELVKLLEQRF